MAPETKPKSDIPTQVFQRFIQDLEGTALSPEVVARLRKTILEEKTLTEKALERAIIGEDSDR